MELKFKIYTILKENTKRYTSREIAKLFNVVNYKYIEKVILNLTKNFRNIHCNINKHGETIFWHEVKE